MAKLVENVYGDALFELALESGKLDEFLEEAKSLLQILEENQDFSQMMCHPKIPKEEKLSCMEGIFKGRADEEIIGLMRLMVEKDHFAQMHDVFDYFIHRAYESKNIGMAKVVTPMELTADEKEKVEKRLLETTRYESFIMDYSVDAALIGGMVIRIGDRVVDSSVKSQISALARELSNIQLKVGECAP